jgi:pyridine nucleotide-disulfide oxidoreductase
MSTTTTEGSATHQTAETQFVDAGGVHFAFRRFGAPGAAPLVMLQHFRGNLDSWDPTLTEAHFCATAPVSEVAKTATYTRAYAESNGFLTLLSDGERLTGAYALGPEAGEWLQQATLAIRARVPLDVLRDTIQPFPTFSEIYLAALKALREEITASRQPVEQGATEERQEVPR